MKKLKVAVIGVGKLGQHHARIYSELKDVELVGICDINKKRRKKISRQLNVDGFSDWKELSGKIDAASVAVPTSLHFEISKTLLKNGVHLLIEKPITKNLDEAEELLDLTEKKNLILQIGHIERFNPAVLEAEKYINKPKFIEASRLGPYDKRMGDVGVVLDLMTHDIDIILLLVKSRVKTIDAIGASLLTKHEDIANTRIKFENGCVANISASRVSLEKYRRIRIFQDDAYISLDYEKQKVKIYKKKREKIQSLKDIKIIRPRLKRGEPLKKELEHFTKCVLEGKKPRVRGKHGRDALEVSLEILKKIKENE